MTRGKLLSVSILSVLLAACGAAAKPDPESPPRPDPREAPPSDPNAEPLFTAARRICRLVDHKDDGLLAVAFAPGFFDSTPPVKLDKAFHDIRDALGRCSDRMSVIERTSPLEGIVAIECENGVLLLSIGLDTSPSRPMLTLGLDMRPASTIGDVKSASTTRHH